MLCPFCQRPVDRFDTPPDGGYGLRCPVCGEDGVPLRYPIEYAAHPAVPVSIVGLTAHGKTVFIDALITHLERRVRWPRFSCQWLDQSGMQESRARLRELREHGRIPDATNAVFRRPQVIRLGGVPRVGGSQLLFYDTGGEAFRDTELLRDAGRYVRHSPAVLWLVSLTELEYPEELTDLLTVYAQAMAEMGGDTRQQSVVLVITKGDLLLDRPDLPPAARDFLLDDDLDPGGEAWGRLWRLSDALEGWLRTTEHRPVVNHLRSQFRAARFCILSAQGAAARDQTLEMDLMPRGVLAPLFWLWWDTLPVAWVETASGPVGPYFTVADAVAAAPPGGTVRLGPHTYTLPARLELRRPVRVVGAGPDRTHLRGAGREFLVGIGLTHGEASLSGLSVAHTSPAAADVIRVAGGAAVLDRCAIRGGVAGADGRTGDGVRVRPAASASLTRCTVELNRGDGVSSLGDARVLLRDCDARANGGAGVRAGGGEARVEASRFTGNGQNGVHLGGDVRGYVHDSACRQNERSGIGAFTTAVVELHRNTCEENALDGIVLKDKVVVAAHENRCTKNRQAGISVHDGVTGEVSAGECSDNARPGVEVEDAAAPNVVGVLCARNKAAGIAYVGTAGGKCSGNTCERNGGSGVLVNDRASPEVGGNVCTKNKGFGFRVAGTAAPRFGKDNRADGNEKGEFDPPKWGKRGWFG